MTTIFSDIQIEAIAVHLRTAADALERLAATRYTHQQTVSHNEHRLAESIRDAAIISRIAVEQSLSAAADARADADEDDDPVWRAEQIRDILKADTRDAQIWQTGGGCLNPILVLDKDENGPLYYVIFSDTWSRHEASFSIMGADEDDEPIREWWPRPDHMIEDVPMDSAGFLALIDREIAAASIL